MSGMLHMVYPEKSTHKKVVQLMSESIKHLSYQGRGKMADKMNKWLKDYVAGYNIGPKS